LKGVDAIHLADRPELGNDDSVAAMKAHAAAREAQTAAKVASRVAVHSAKIATHATSALKKATESLDKARAEVGGLSEDQRYELGKVEKAFQGVMDSTKGGQGKTRHQEQDSRLNDLYKSIEKNAAISEREILTRELEHLREMLRSKHASKGEVHKLEDVIREVDGSDLKLDALKVEVERLRQVIEKMDNHRQKLPASSQQLPARTLDIATKMPFGELQPFGREDTAQELTEASVKESNEMVDQVERAEVAEEKRSVFRALTHLRGAVIASYDGVAGSQTSNIDEYNKHHRWLDTHPLKHLAAEESDVSKWAFPGDTNS